MPKCMRTMKRDDRVRNEYLRDSIFLVSIVDKIRENRQMVWSCDKKRGNESRKVIMRMNVEKRTEKEKQKKR